ncbi:MAG: 50S ribosomal protein L11 methyltransferase [Verrucomicrobia bacterium]|nr:50S ribosomal protein L11 methyltransferase [Verrucomicrobiota bacterium]
MKPVSQSTLAWRKICHEKWVDSWQERLLWLGSERLVITQFSGSKRVRLEIYAVTGSEAAVLKKEFGGEIRNLSRSSADWVKSIVQKKPIPIRGRLRIVNLEPEAEQTVDGDVIFVPASLAFGTGEHATTAGCLRLLCDIVHPDDTGWTFLDVGTGTGILALAAAKLGAGRVEAIDADAIAVRTAKQNARLNRLSGKIRIWRQDVLKFRPESAYDVVAANLYSVLLRQALPQLVKAARKGGFLIFSGILRDQEAEVKEWLREKRLELKASRSRGKWTTLLAQRSGTTRSK